MLDLIGSTSLARKFGTIDKACDVIQKYSTIRLAQATPPPPFKTSDLRVRIELKYDIEEG